MQKFRTLFLILQSLAVAASALHLIQNIRRLYGKQITSLGYIPLDGPMVSIIVPARNEERSIKRCITSLLAQDYHNFEVIAVDDGSTDATPEILAQLAADDPRLQVVRVHELPAGWAGKAHAIHTGVQHANGEWLLFTDADTDHQPDALSTLLNVARCNHADLLSIVTKQELKTFWERTMTAIPMIGISILFPLEEVEDPNSPIALANGQYMLLKHSAYEDVGGYAAIPSVVMDDIVMAQRLKQAGKRVMLVDGRDYVSVRMYHNFGEFWRGWGKNVYPHNTREMIIIAGGLVVVPLIFLLPFIQLVRTFISGKRGSLFWISLGQVAMILYSRRIVDRGLHLPWYYIFLHPLGVIMIEALIVETFWRTWTRKGVGWKDRTYIYNAAGVSKRLDQGESKV